MPNGRRPTASLYIDGLNLYRRILAGHPEHKWLDIEAWGERVTPEYDLVRVRYFTAVIKLLPVPTSGRRSVSRPICAR